jgi:hypothetical protein
MGRTGGVICPSRRRRAAVRLGQASRLARVTPPRGVCSATVKRSCWRREAAGRRGRQSGLNGTPPGTEVCCSGGTSQGAASRGAGCTGRVGVVASGPLQVDVRRGPPDGPLLRCSKGRVVGSKTAVSWDELLSTGAVRYVSRRRTTAWWRWYRTTWTSARPCELHPSADLSCPSVAALVPFNHSRPQPVCVQADQGVRGVYGVVREQSGRVVPLAALRAAPLVDRRLPRDDELRTG